MPGPDRSRELLELRALVSENNFCINCRSKTPGYVCITFSTFVCTKCAGVHRSFMHVIRSITLSSLSDAEMELLRAGGNAVAEKVWFASWSETEEPRPSPHDENALRKFIRLAYVDKRWQQGSSPSYSADQDFTLSAAPQNAISGGGNLNFDLSTSYAAAPPSNDPMKANGDYNLPIMPLNGHAVAPDATMPSHLVPIDLPLSASPMDLMPPPQHHDMHSSPSYNAISNNPLDLISWDERPAANSLPTNQEEAPRRPVYHVQQHTSSPSASISHRIQREQDSPQYHVSQSQDVRYGSPSAKDPEISRLEELLATQQRQFQQQLEQTQREQQKLQHQLQQARIQQQINDHQMAMSKQMAPAHANPEQYVAPSQIPPASSMHHPSAAHPKMYAPSMPVGGHFPYQQQQMPNGARPMHMQAPSATQTSPSASGAQNIMVLGPNGQLVTLEQARMASGTQAPARQTPPAVPTHPSAGISFTPLVTARGQAVAAPASSPLATRTLNSAAELPPGSIGPHWVPAPGGGMQAVYMVPSGTLPPGSAQTNRASANPAAPKQSMQYPGAYPAASAMSKQEHDDMALALRLQQQFDSEAQAQAPKPVQVATAPNPAPPKRFYTGPSDDYFNDSLAANASYIANDEELARQLAAAELSDEE